MKRIFILLILCWCSAAVAAQDSSFTLLRSYEGDIADAALDNLDNLYIISTTGQVKKFTPAGDSVGPYNQLRNFGKLYTIDVSNPLKVLLFYKDFSTVVVLDRFLANIATLDLRRHNILQPVAIGLSYDNNIWVFDAYDNKLKKLDEQGNLLFESSDYRSAFGQGLSPQKIINDNGSVYLADSASGVYVFDNYGTFRKRLPVKSWQSISVFRNQIISTTGDQVMLFNPATQMETGRKYSFFQPYVRSFTTTNRLVNFSARSLRIYQYQF